MAEWETWSPPATPNVIGEYERRVVDERGVPQPQTVKMRCVTCGAKWATVCPTGHVRVHIARFAVKHMHRDPFAKADTTRE